MARTVPSAVTMPVNIQCTSSRIRSACRRRAALRAAREKRGICVQPLDAERLHRRPAVAAHHRRGMEPGDAVHQVGAQQRRGELCAALHQHPGEARVCRARSAPAQVDAGFGAGAPRSASRRASAKARAAVGIGAFADQHPGRESRARWRPGARSAACADGCPRRCAPAASGRNPGRRQVRSGSSASTVPTPTITASCRPRSACAARRAGVAGDPAALAACGGDAAVQRGGELQRDQRAAVAHAVAKPASDFVAPRPPARLRQPRCRQRAVWRCPAPFTRGSGSRVRDHHAGDAGGDQRVGAGRACGPSGSRAPASRRRWRRALPRRPCPAPRVRRAAGRRAR